MSEDNMNAVTSLQREEHVNKELSNRLAQVEDELNQTGSDLADKQRYVSLCRYPMSLCHTRLPCFCFQSL